MQRLLLPDPPDPASSQFKSSSISYDRAQYDWARKSKGAIETVAAANWSAEAIKAVVGGSPDAIFGVVNVVDSGADPTGVADSSPAFRAALRSNSAVVVPPGTYRFASIEAPPGGGSFSNTAVAVQGLSNFRISGYGATILIDASAALSSAFHFDECTKFLVEGLTIIGNRTGLATGDENAAIAVTSDVDFTFRDLFLSGFYSNGTAVVGDWLVNGLFDNIIMDGVGHGFDVAFLQHITVQNVRGAGAANSDGTGTGQNFFSLIQDEPNSALNNTGIAFASSDDVTIRGCAARNFNAGAAIATGSHVSLLGNTWESNLGTGGVPGIGVYVYYNNGGPFSSVGFPVSGLTISGDRFIANGQAGTGYGLLIDTSAIANSDAISNVTIANNLFDNNSQSGIGWKSTANTSNIVIFGNVFYGVNQVTATDTNTFTVSSIFQQGGALWVSSHIALPNASGLTINDTTGIGQPVFFGDVLNETVIRPLAGNANVAVQSYAGAYLMRAWSDHVEMVAPPVLPQKTVATLPAASASLKGALCGVTDASSPTYGGALTGGGSTSVIAYCNGSSWTAH